MKIQPGSHIFERENKASFPITLAVVVVLFVVVVLPLTLNSDFKNAFRVIQA